ncbi:hypothetical protein B296_00023879 [Ensete ventricosum]|uniref:Uncharacterized protein n=1 Tax=Ensete ventricosum TaxID=4639 RepID=A0A426Z5X8_ENSVE|nr:hypothetical protein B296_00023879 [Ensete ventricosum]
MRHRRPSTKVLPVDLRLRERQGEGSKGFRFVDRRPAMVHPRKEDGSDRSSDGDAGEGFRANNGSESAHGVGVAEGLRESLRGVSVDDLSHEGSGGAGDDRVLLWLQALDLQVLGACRADERSMPLFKLNVSSGPAEEKLLAQLSQVLVFSPPRFLGFLLLVRWIYYVICGFRLIAILFHFPEHGQKLLIQRRYV